MFRGDGLNKIMTCGSGGTGEMQMVEYKALFVDFVHEHSNLKVFSCFVASRAVRGDRVLACAGDETGR
jgi:hypothetical protein